MGNSLKAENLKYKRTFAKKLIFIGPAVMFLLTFWTPTYAQANAFNWWYTTILPGCAALMAALVNQKEEKKLGYRAVLTLPVSLKRTWAAKCLLTALYVTASCLLLTVVILLESTINLYSVPPITFSPDKVVLGVFVMALSALWQVPFCLYLSNRMGILGTILINVGLGIFLGIGMVDKALWWVCPFSWTMRIMTPVLGILPNGMMALKGDPMLNPSSVPVGIALSLLLFAALVFLTASLFQKQEAK